MTVRTIPEGYNAVAPCLIVQDAAKAIAFYQQAFGAEEHMRLTMPDGGIGHAEVRIGGCIVMLGEENHEMGLKSPATTGSSPASLHLYVEDSDAVFQQAIAAGAKEIKPVENMFWGDRAGRVEDPFGYQWIVSTHVEDVPEEEIKQRVLKLSA